MFKFEKRFPACFAIVCVEDSTRAYPIICRFATREVSVSHCVCSSSLLQFLGSEESILEYEPDRSGVNQQSINPQTTISLAQAPAPTAGAPSALADLIRSRDFVIDFPRVFLLNSGSVVGARETLFPARLPERSQSSLSLRQARDWMSQMSNKLDEQQGLRRVRKDEMQQVRVRGRVGGIERERKTTVCPFTPLQQLLSARDSARQRRSRSADGRYATGCFGRQRAPSLQQQSQQAAVAALEAAPPHMRRTSSTHTLQQLTDTSYAQSRQRQRETFDFARTRRRFMQRDSDEISLQSIPRRSAPVPAAAVAPSHSQRDSEGGEYITIQVNGEGVHFNE